MTTIPRSIRLLFAIFLTQLIWLFALRLAFWGYFHNPLDSLPGNELLEAFYLGSKYDTRLILTILLPPILLGWIPGLRLFDQRFGRKLWLGYLSLAFLAVLFVYLSDFGYYAYLNKRLDSTILRFLPNFDISIEMVWETYSVIKWSLLLLGLTLGYWLLLRYLFNRFAAQAKVPLGRWRKSITLTSTAFLVLFGLYGKWSWYPLRWSDAYFSTRPFASAVAINPILHFINTLKNKDVKFDVGKVRNAYPQMAEYLGVNARDPRHLNFIRFEKGNSLKANKPNIVLVYLESFAAYKTGIFGNPLDPTPNFDAMAKQGLFFKNFYTPHTGTARSVFAGITGLPDVEMHETSTRNPLIINQHTLVNAFKGYQKFYFIGGSASWGNIRGILSHNIPDLHLYEESMYQSPRMDVWGISDIDLFKEANKVLKKQKEPFIAIIQTSGNHRPYDVPEDNHGFKYRHVDKATLQRDGFISDREFNSFRFMDHSIGYFIKQAKKQGYFKNTIFVFWGDHGITGYAGEHSPPYITQTRLSGMHVPFLIYSPKLIPQPKVYDKAASELDVLPTIAGLAAPTYVNTSLGRNLLNPQFDAERYAFTITHYKVPEIGLVSDKFYFLMNADGTHKRLIDLSRNDDSLTDTTDQHPNIARKMQHLCVDLYETAKYMRYHNGNKALKLAPAH